MLDSSAVFPAFCVFYESPFCLRSSQVSHHMDMLALHAESEKLLHIKNGCEEIIANGEIIIEMFCCFHK